MQGEERYGMASKGHGASSDVTAAEPKLFLESVTEGEFSSDDPVETASEFINEHYEEDSYAKIEDIDSNETTTSSVQENIAVKLGR